MARTARPQFNGKKQTWMVLLDSIKNEKLADTTFSLRHFYLQSFAEFCGWKAIS